VGKKKVSFAQHVEKLVPDLKVTWDITHKLHRKYQKVLKNSKLSFVKEAVDLMESVVAWFSYPARWSALEEHGRDYNHSVHRMHQVSSTRWVPASRTFAPFSETYRYSELH